MSEFEVVLAMSLERTRIMDLRVYLEIVPRDVMYAVCVVFTYGC